MAGAAGGGGGEQRLLTPAGTLVLRRVWPSTRSLLPQACCGWCPHKRMPMAVLIQRHPPSPPWPLPAYRLGSASRRNPSCDPHPCHTYGVPSRRNPSCNPHPYHTYGAPSRPIPPCSHARTLTRTVVTPRTQSVLTSRTYLVAWHRNCPGDGCRHCARVETGVGRRPAVCCQHQQV
eukprot:365304-Chlamydomonas_euryale.AAC.4